MESPQISVSDLLSLMTIRELRILVRQSGLQPYVRRYWKQKKMILVNQLVPYFVIRIDGNTPYLARVIEDYRVIITI